MRMEVVPGRNLGPFAVGAPLAEVFAHLQQDPQLARQKLDVKFHGTSPLSEDIVIDVPGLGIHVCVDPRIQTVKCVEVHNPGLVGLHYDGNVLLGSGQRADFESLYAVFGPTTPGECAEGTYFLSYPGLTLCFQIPEEDAPRFATGTTDLPIKLGGGRVASLSRVMVYDKGAVVGGDGTPIISKLHAITPPPRPDGSPYFELVQVHLGTGLFFTQRNATVSFGDAAQDVMSVLGRPSKVFIKEDARLRIHTEPSPAGSDSSAANANATTNTHDDAGQPSSAEAMHGETAPRADYFYNYFHLGLDAMFDGSTHTVRKLILHTNFPGDPEFNEYCKSHFDVLLGEGAAIGQDDTWDDARRKILQSLPGDLPQRPVVSSKSTRTNPFGMTHLYGIEHGVIFEVLPSRHIASVTLFSPNDVHE